LKNRNPQRIKLDLTVKVPPEVDHIFDIEIRAKTTSSSSNE